MAFLLKDEIIDFKRKIRPKGLYQRLSVNSKLGRCKKRRKKCKAVSPQGIEFCWFVNKSREFKIFLALIIKNLMRTMPFDYV